jgi:Ca2+-binding EF-hand superfamily protein
VYLNKEQFEDVFSGLTSLYDELFELIAERDVASTFEMLAAMSIFSGETYETKCAFIFRLFDFDVSNTLDREEMNRTLQCVCRAMCKVSGLACPSHRALVQLADVCFQMMDTDRNHHVDYGEWYQWTSENEELQEFLL